MSGSQFVWRAHQGLYDHQPCSAFHRFRQFLRIWTTFSSD
jgi:hypothetical protein